MSIEGYTSATSVVQGGVLKICASNDPPSEVQISVERSGNPTPIYEAIAHVDSYPTPPNASETGCSWPSFHEISVPTHWASGLYRINLINLQGESISMHIIVRARIRGQTSPILFQFAASTAQAYNRWGGKSLYKSDSPERARKVSFNRPGGVDYGRWELPFLNWMERNGYLVECCTSLDLHEDTNYLDHYQLLVSVGHDEYWSKEMRDNVERFIGNGGNVAFFSGNVCWWQVRFEDQNRTMVCYKTALEDPLSGLDNSRVTVEWHSSPVTRPENTLTGVSFRHGAGFWQICSSSLNVKKFQVRFSEHWVFEGTRLRDNDFFGKGHNIVGYETDAAEFIEIDGVPQVTGRDGTPSTFVVLATADLRDWGPCGKAGHATMGIYRRTGVVFTAATTNWVNGFCFPESPVHQITRNVLNRLQHPCRMNQWETIGEAADVVSLAALNGKLFAATKRNILCSREPIGQNISWKDIGIVSDIVAMTGGDNMSSNLGGKLYAATQDGRFWCLNPAEVDQTWELIGRADGVVALAATNGRLYAVTKDGKFWWREPKGVDAAWQEVGRADGVVTLATLNGALLAVSVDKKLLWKAPDNQALTWQYLGEALDVVTLAAVSGKLFATTHDHRLLWRDCTC